MPTMQEVAVGGARRKVADREEAEALLAAWQGSSERLAQFSRARGIDGRSLHCWWLNLRRQRQAPREQAPQLRLVELSLPTRQARYRVFVGDIHVEVDDDFHEDTLARLLAVVSAC